MPGLGSTSVTSMGLMLFGLTYGYLAVFRWEVLRTLYSLAGLGLLTLVGYVVLARGYWFKAPLIVSLPTLFYLVGIVGAFAEVGET